MRTIQVVFAILFAYLIGVKGGAIPEITDVDRNENETRANAICISNADCYEVEKCVLEEINGQGSCVCRAGRIGNKCQIVEDCVTGKYSRCKDGNGRCSYNDIKETAECDCGVSKKWDNMIKLCRNTCANSGECANNGVCGDAGDGEKFCTCNPGTLGDFCEKVVDCEPEKGGIFCGSGGDVKCVYDESNQGGNCLCENSTKLFNYDKKRCQVPCSDDCQNGGTCEKVRNYRFCICKQDTSGDLCQKVDECFDDEIINCGLKAYVRCVYDEKNEKAMCKCDDPKKLFDYRDKICRNSCSTNEDCESFEKCTVLESGDKFCRCPNGKSGERCETVIACMKNYETCIGGNGTCIYNEEEETTECDCGDGKLWNYSEGSGRCQTPCENNCANNGVCKVLEPWKPRFKFCKCISGSSGDFCENARDCDVLKICGSDTNVKCVYDYKIKGGKCVCKNFTKFFDYYEGKCRVPCKDNCHNNGKCEYVRGQKFCSCQPGTSGDLCETVDDCTNFCGIKSDVKCVYEKTGGSPTCKCVDQNKSFDVYAKECRIPCNDDCLNNGKCEYVRGIKFCSCKQGTSGNRCEISDDCSTNFCGTESDVKCVYDQTEKISTCTCDDPYKTFDSDTKKCRRSTCADYTCQNEGSCNDDPSGAPRCYCKFPFTGERCEKGPCTSSPCKNGGTCQMKDNTYICICWGNFYGTSCEMENRFVISSVLTLLALIILALCILTCIGCFQLKMNEKLNSLFQKFGVHKS